MKSSLHILGSRQGGGAERFFVRLVQHLRAAGHRTYCIMPPVSWCRDQLGEHPDNIYIPMRSVWDLLSRWTIKRTISQLQPDIVQTYMGRATRLTHINPKRGPIHIARLGGYYKLKGYRHAHAWIGNTRGISEYLIKEGLPRDKVFHIGNFVEPQPHENQADINNLKALHGIPENAWLLMAIGRLHPNKGFIDLIEAMSLLPSEVSGRPIHLVIAGDGPLRDALHQQATTMDCSKNIHWAGWIDKPSLYYQAADLFICPSRHEPLGNVILEAWANNAPIISTASDGARELITHGKNGVLTPLEDPQALAASIQKWLSTETEARSSLGNHGLIELQENFSPSVIIERYLDIYNRLT